MIYHPGNLHANVIPGIDMSRGVMQNQHSNRVQNQCSVQYQYSWSLVSFEKFFRLNPNLYIVYYLDGSV